MALDSISQLGQILGSMSSNQTTLSQNISPDENEAQLNLFWGMNVLLVSTLTINAKTYATDSFILDHPVQGALDSAVYKLDGGYSATSLLYSTTF